MNERDYILGAKNKTEAVRIKLREAFLFCRIIETIILGPALKFIIQENFICRPDF